MKNIDIQKCKVGLIYTFITKSDPNRFYVARVKNYDSKDQKIITICYITNEYDIIIPNGDFSYFLYDCRESTEIERRKFVALEISKGDAPEKLGFKVGDKVTYLGYKNENDIMCCFEKGETIEVISIGEKVTCVGNTKNKKKVAQSIMLNQIKPLERKTEILDTLKAIKFKVGDHVIGNILSNCYVMTRQNWVGTVTKTSLNSISCKSFLNNEIYDDLNPNYFDLYKNVYTEIPKEGWCKDATSALGHYLSDKLEVAYIDPGRKGYSWNAVGYWSLVNNSGRPPINMSDIKHLVESYEKSKDISDEYPRELYIDGINVSKVPVQPLKIKLDKNKIINRVVKPRYTPNKTDDAYRKKSLVIELESVPDRSIKIRVK